MNYTYIVKCSDGTFYTGWTNAPLAWAVAGRILGKSIENFTHAGNVRHEAEERVLK